MGEMLANDVSRLAAAFAAALPEASSRLEGLLLADVDAAESLASTGAHGALLVRGAALHGQRCVEALGGHAGVVTCVAMSPNAAEPVIASGGTDKRVFVGELGRVDVE